MPKNFAQAKKAGIFIIKKCGWKNLWKNENAVSASRLKITAESLQDAEREDDGEYCEESWQQLKGITIMSGETLVEKLDLRRKARSSLLSSLSPGRDPPRKRKLQKSCLK